MKMPNPLKLKALLIDLNGTLHLGSEPTKNAIQAIEKLRKARIPFIFCSNSTKESSASLLAKLNEMGFKASQEELMTSLGACRQLVEERGLRRPLLLMSPSAKEEFSTLPSSSSEGERENYDSVILGLHEPSLSYESLNRAFRVLKREPISSSGGASSPAAPSSTSLGEAKRDEDGQNTKPIPLIAPHAAMFQQSPATSSFPAGLSLGIGPFVRGLEEATGTQAEIVGKPTSGFFKLALQRLGTLPSASQSDEDGKSDGRGSKRAFGPSEVGVVGDDVVNDLGNGARELGLKRILVRTGKYRPDYENKSDHPPDRVYEDFAAFVEDLVESCH